MRGWSLPILIVALGACAREEPVEEPADASTEDAVMVVADSVIERELTTRLDSDPRLDVEGIQVAARSEDQNVILSGEVPTRREWSFVRELTQSTPGVRAVIDSIVIASEEGYEGGTGTPDTARPRT